MDDKDKAFVSKLLRDLSHFRVGHSQLMSQGIMPALVRLAKNEDAEIKQDVASALCRLSMSPDLASDMVEEGLVEALYWLTLEDLLGLTKSVLLRSSVTCRNVVTSDEVVRKLAADSSRFTKVLDRLSTQGDFDLLVNVAVVYFRLTCLPDTIVAFHKGDLSRVNVLCLSCTACVVLLDVSLTCMNQAPTSIHK